MIEETFRLAFLHYRVITSENISSKQPSWTRQNESHFISIDYVVIDFTSNVEINIKTTRMLAIKRCIFNSPNIYKWMCRNLSHSQNISLQNGFLYLPWFFLLFFYIILVYQSKAKWMINIEIVYGCEKTHMCPPQKRQNKMLIPICLICTLHTFHTNTFVNAQ